jgi:ABC-type sulfate/molybdate transport systems ATPase subunit
MNDVGISDFADAYPHQLSGGQKQRVALARAVASFSQLLLLDEPFSALDELNRHKMYELLLKMREKYDLTILMVTHTVPEAVSYSDQMMIMHNGSIAQFGAVPQLLKEPHSLEVAKILKAGIYGATQYISYKDILFGPKENYLAKEFSVIKRQTTLNGMKFYFNWDGVENSLETNVHPEQIDTITVYYHPSKLFCFPSIQTDL